MCVFFVILFKFSTAATRHLAAGAGPEPQKVRPPRGSREPRSELSFVRSAFFFVLVLVWHELGGFHQTKNKKPVGCAPSEDWIHCVRGIRDRSPLFFWRAGALTARPNCAAASARPPDCGIRPKSSPMPPELMPAGLAHCVGRRSKCSGRVLDILGGEVLVTSLEAPSPGPKAWNSGTPHS